MATWTVDRAATERLEALREDEQELSSAIARLLQEGCRVSTVAKDRRTEVGPRWAIKRPAHERFEVVRPV